MGNIRLVALLAGDELVLFSDTVERVKDPASVLRPSYDDKFTFKPVIQASSPFYFIIQLTAIWLLEISRIFGNREYSHYKSKELH